jgi:ATP-dependent helicase/nuclease subunit A
VDGGFPPAAAPRWNESQLEAICCDEPGILVSAAAGSGKTAVLVERIKRLIAEKGVPLSAMLILTFTNAAAAEMRQKIANSLTERVAAEDSAFLREQLSGIHRASIGTFHAFAMDLVHRYYFKAGLPPGLRACDEAQRSLIMDEAADALFADRFENDCERLSLFLDCFSDGRSEDGVRKHMLFDVYDAVRARPDAFEWLHGKVELLGRGGEEIMGGAVGDEARRDIASGIGGAMALCAEAGRLLDAAGADAMAGLCREDADGLGALLDSLGRDWPEGFATAANAFRFRRLAPPRGPGGDAYRKVEDRVRRLRDRAKKALKERVKDRYCRRPMDAYVADINGTYAQAAYLRELVEDFHGRFERAKLDRGLMDFADMEHYALRALRDEEAAGECRDRFRYIFVDEYQDNSLMQESILSRINVGNSIFLVGDVKQSIYRFRLAEPGLFLRRGEDFSGGDGRRRIELNVNYRSKAAVIDAVNGVFSRLMSRETAGMDYDGRAALRKGLRLEDERRWSRPAELYVVDDGEVLDESGPDGGGAGEADEGPGADGGAAGDAAGDAAAGLVSAMGKAELEASAAVGIVRGELFGPDGRRRRIFDTKAGADRDLGLRDIVLLMRSARPQAEVFQRVFAEAGLPAFVSVGEGYFDTLEIETFMNLLRIIDNRRHDVALLSVMYSPVFGFSTKELMDIRLALPGRPYYDALFLCAGGGAGAGLGQALAGKCARMLEKLREWRERAAFMPLDEFVWALVKECGYYHYAGALPGGAQRQANLRALADKALGFQRTHMKGLAGFIGYAERARGSAETGQTRLVAEGEDVLRIMTVHRSKGLEFPVVIVAGLGRRFVPERDAPVKIHKDIGIGLRWVDPSAGLYKKTLVQSAIEGRDARENFAEELRILYVAFTRAMDRLILLGTAGGGAEGVCCGASPAGARSGLELLAPIAPEAGIVTRTLSRAEARALALGWGRAAEGAAPPPPQPGTDGVRAAGDDGAADAEAYAEAEVGRRLGFEYPWRDAALIKSKYAAGELYAAGAPEGLPRGTGPGAWGGRAYVPAAPRFMQAASPISAAEKGSVLHRFMELLDFREAVGRLGDPGYLAGELGRLAARGIFTEDEARAVDVDKIRAFVASGICGRAARSSSLRKEAPFIFRKAIGGEEVLVQGVIDCCFVEDGSFVLLDYKSGSLYPWAGAAGEDMAELAARRYRPQLSVYAEALERTWGMKVAEAHLYLLNEGLDITVGL